MIPSGKYAWLNKEPGPAILKVAIDNYGITEIPGPKHSNTILGWAKKIGGWIASYYTNDEIAWCGLFVGFCAQEAGFPFNQTLLGAKNWLNWGNPVKEPMLGDVLVFSRDGGGHVGFYVGEDKECYHVLGGNQGNQVNVTRILKSRLAGARRCKWKVAQPANVRKVFLEASGTVSKNEA